MILLVAAVVCVVGAVVLLLLRRSHQSVGNVSIPRWTPVLPLGLAVLLLDNQVADRPPGRRRALRGLSQ